MTDSPAPPNIPPSSSPIGNNFDADTLAPRELRVVLVCDVVESVRWMEQDEDDAVSRWQAFTQHVRHSIVPAHGASVVKSTGDGMMIEFASARSAVQASAAMHSAAALANQGKQPERFMLLRAGIHETHARRDAFDLYGHGVNLAARITTLAGPGETIVSAPVRDHLTDTLDGDIEDMGECYLKHIAEPQRVYRIGTASAEPILVPVREYAEPLQPTIAVIPFESRSHAPEDFAIGELIADGVIGLLGQTKELRIISRLSTTALRSNLTSFSAAQRCLAANFIASGSYIVSGDELLVQVELSNTSNSEVIWSTRIKTKIGDLLLIESETCSQIANGVHCSLMNQQAQRALTHPIPTLTGYSLLLGSINLMHRSSNKEFLRSREALDHLIERHKKNALVRAWSGKWHILSVVRGISPNSRLDTQCALDETNRAQDIEPSSAYALAIQGHAICHLANDPVSALEKINQAIALNPNESVAWLYKSVWSSMWGTVDDAVIQAENAKSLSPIDPMAYYYNMILTGAYAFAGQYDKAIASGNLSLRQNKHHSPTLRVILLAQYESGMIMAAKQTLAALLNETPQLTVQSYLSMGNGHSQSRQRVATALRALGLKEN